MTVCAVQPELQSEERIAEERTEGAASVDVVASRELGKEIDDRRILRDINIRIGSGDFTALLGANGAGKTTLLKIIATLIPASEGTIELFGTRLTRENGAVRSRIGLIGHGMMLYRDLGILDNLLFFGRLYGVRNPRQRAEVLLEQVGLHHRRFDAVGTLSRGMAQRASIARALMHDPELLLADEPFAGLDAPSAAMLEGVLQRLNESGKTIVLVNHNVGQSLELAGRAVVLRQGRVVIDAAAEELTTGEVLKEVGGS